jgi:hypothetical protein
MQRWSTAAFSLLLLGAIVLVVLGVRSPAPATAPESTASAAARELTDPLSVLAPADAGSDPDSGPADLAFSTFPDGGSVPQLPATAPSEVSFGVILFKYDGAQFAQPGARTKEEALEKAGAALAESRRDFAEAVKQGDPGSTADAGRIPRGILEPPVEYILFTMEPDSVYDEPVDTPRGYWILRRNK